MNLLFLSTFSLFITETLILHLIQFYHIADKFSKSFEDAYRAIRKLEEGFLDPLRTPTIEEKLQLSHDIFKVGSYELARVLTMLEESVPTAVARKLSTDELLINFDAIPAKVFHEIYAYVLNCIATMTSSKKGKKRKSEAGSGAGVVDL